MLKWALLFCGSGIATFPTDISDGVSTAVPASVLVRVPPMFCVASAARSGHTEPGWQRRPVCGVWWAWCVMAAGGRADERTGVTRRVVTEPPLH